LEKSDVAEGRVSGAVYHVGDMPMQNRRQRQGARSPCRSLVE
jgi:hypothetical protein